MDVVFRDVRQVVVDDVRQGLDVEAPRGDVGGDEHLQLAVLEALQGLHALRLALVAVDRRGFDSRSTTSFLVCLYHQSTDPYERLEPGANHRPKRVISSDLGGDRRAVAVIELHEAPAGGIRHKVLVPEGPQYPDLLRHRAAESRGGDEAIAIDAGVIGRRIVGEVRVELVQADGRGIAHPLHGVRPHLQRDADAVAGREGPEVAGHGTVQEAATAGAGRGRYVRDSAGQRVRNRDAGGVLRALIGDGDAVAQHVALIRALLAVRLGDRQIHGRPEFKRADVADSSCRKGARHPALVGRRAGGVAAGVDGGTARRQGAGLSNAAVVGEHPEQGVLVAEVARGTEGACAAAIQVVAAGGDHTAAVAAGAAGNEGVGQGHSAGGVGDAAACGGGIVAERDVDERGSAAAVEDTAAAAIGAIARDGDVGERGDGGACVEDAAAVSACTVGAVAAQGAGGDGERAAAAVVDAAAVGACGIAADGRICQRQRAKIEQPAAVDSRGVGGERHVVER